ncbi:MAG: hypothetical protein LBU45_05720 [Azoarcus sp.]|jgi:hypothetical protein|nr:hypothetical protein [Azoarcus sp.]
MSDYLIQNCGNKGYTNLAISMPIEMLPAYSNHFACSALGFWDGDYFRQLQIQGSDVALSANFFIWWNQSQGCDHRIAFRRAICPAWQLSAGP